MKEIMLNEGYIRVLDSYIVQLCCVLDLVVGVFPGINVRWIISTFDIAI